MGLQCSHTCVRFLEEIVVVRVSLSCVTVWLERYVRRQNHRQFRSVAAAPKSQVLNLSKLKFQDHQIITITYHRNMPPTTAHIWQEWVTVRRCSQGEAGASTRVFFVGGGGLFWLLQPILGSPGIPGILVCCAEWWGEVVAFSFLNLGQLFKSWVFSIWASFSQSGPAFLNLGQLFSICV